MSGKTPAGPTKEKRACDGNRDVRDSRLEEIEALYRMRYPAFLRVAAAIAGDEESGAEAVQEGFAGVVRSRGRFRGGSLDAWVWAAVVNSARTIRRRPSALRLMGHSQEPGGGVDAPPETSELRRAIATLPERQRLVLFLHYFADLDYRSIAEIVGIRQGTVGATLTAARGALHRALTEEQTCTR